MADNSLKELSEMQKLTSSMVKDFKSMLKGKEGLNKEIKKEFQLTQDIVKNLKSTEQIDKAIEELKKRQAGLDEKKFGTNKGLLLAYESQLKATIESLNVNKSLFKLDEKRANILKKVEDITNSATEKLNNGLDELKGKIEKIPIVGKTFSKLIPFDKLKTGVDDLGKKFMGGFKESFTKSMMGGKNVATSVLSGMRGGIASMGAAVRALGPMLSGPQAIIAAIVAVLALGVLRVYQLSEASKKFKQETGLTNSQVKFLGRQISVVTANTKFLGATMEDVSSAAATLSNEFHNLREPSTAVVENMVVLNKNFGIALDDAAKLNHIFMNMGNLSQEQAQAMVSVATNMANAGKVAPNKVIKDLAANSEAAYKYFGGSYQELIKAGVAAAQLGTSIGNLTKTADALLDFETSITDELQASAVLGRRFDLTQARSAAAADDLLGMNKAIVAELNKQGDITQLSKWDKMALAKATKMELSELVNMQKVYNKFGHLQEEQLGFAMEKAKLGMDVTKMSEEELKLLMEQDKKNQEMQGKFTQMKNAFAGIGDIILDAFLPIGEVVVGVLLPVFKVLGALVRGFFQPMVAGIKNIWDAVSMLFAPFKDIFGEGAGDGFLNVLSTIVAIFRGPLMFGINLAAGMIRSIANIFGGIVKIFKGDFKEGFTMIFKGALQWIARIPIALWDTITGVFPQLGEWIKEWFSGIWNSITSFATDALDSIAGFFGFGSSDSSKAQTEAAQPAGSVNDGVIQNGKIITTNPADTLIASKSPGELFQKAMEMTPLGMLANGIGGLLGSAGGTKMDLGPLIAEIQGLRADMAAGKIAVNMDGRKITSGVSKVSSQSSGNSYVQK